GDQERRQSRDDRMGCSSITAGRQRVSVEHRSEVERYRERRERPHREDQKLGRNFEESERRYEAIERDEHRPERRGAKTDAREVEQPPTDLTGDHLPEARDEYR